MAPSSYMLWALSGPTVVSEPLWIQFYKEEHLADLVKFGVATRAGFYEEVPLAPGAPENKQKFLAVYQTDYEECMKDEHYLKNARPNSELFPKEGGPPDIVSNGTWDVRNYELIQTFDPMSKGEAAAPFQVTVEMEPKDVDDFDKWYREEHLDMLSKMPGYRRSLRYKLGPKTPLTVSETRFLAIHEVDDLAAFASPEGKAASETPWSVKNISEAKAFVPRAWRLHAEEGFTKSQL